MARSWSLARRAAAEAAAQAEAEESSSSTSESVQSVNMNMSAVEHAPIEETGANTSSSGSFRSSTFPSQPIRTQSLGQLVGGGSEVEAEHRVEAVGACTSSSGSSHPSTSSAQHGGGQSTLADPSRKRSRTAASNVSDNPVVSESQHELSVLQNTIDSVNDVNTATAVAPVLQVAEPPRRFPAAMLRPRVDPRLPPAPVQALIRIGNCVVSISAQQYMGLDEPRRDQIRRRHIINLENLHKMLILEATSLDWERNCALKSPAERQGHGPQSATQYMDMIRDAADPPAPYVALERDARFLEPMLVVQEADFVPSDVNFKYQDEEARRYRATVALMLHRYFEGCGSWTNYPGYHSFAHSVMPLTELDHSVLAALLDGTICDILTVASTGPSALRAATQLEKQRCMQYLYGAMAKAALAKDMKVEPLFLSLATELVVNDSTNSLDDHMDLPETTTQQLRKLLKSFDLDAKGSGYLSVYRANDNRGVPYSSC